MVSEAPIFHESNHQNGAKRTFPIMRDSGDFLGGAWGNGWLLTVRRPHCRL